MNFFALILPTILGLFCKVQAEAGRHSDCGCPHDEAVAKVVELTKRLQTFAQACDFKSALLLSTPNASFATTDYYCRNGCCSDVGGMEKWWSYYNCQTILRYPSEPFCVKTLKNGTIVVSQDEIGSQRPVPDVIEEMAYHLNYYWFPVGKCEFQLGYLTGNSYNCPAYIPGAIPCDQCQ